MTSTIDANDTALPELLKNLRAGDTVILTSGDDRKPIAKVEPILASDEAPKRIGALAHLNIHIPDSFFFDPLPEEELRAWEGEDEQEP